MDNTLATVTHETRCDVNYTIKTSPESLTFHRNMFIDFPIMEDLVAIKNNRQQQIDTNLQSHNDKHYNYHYTLEQRIMIKVYDSTTMKEKLHRSYPIL